MQRADLGSWCCPGGLMDLNESVGECLRREVYEETGLAISSPQLIGIYSGSRYNGSYPNGDKIAGMVVAFFTRQYTGSLRSDEESLQLRFFPLSALPQPITGQHQEYLGHLKEHLDGRLELPVVV